MRIFDCVFGTSGASDGALRRATGWGCRVRGDGNGDGLEDDTGGSFRELRLCTLEE